MSSKPKLRWPEQAEACRSSRPNHPPVDHKGLLGALAATIAAYQKRSAGRASCPQLPENTLDLEQGWG